MRNTISKAMIAGLTALSLTASVFATAEPAAAAHYWHGGGWHGGGWHGGGRWHGGGWWGPAVVGGLAAGALAAPYVYGYGSCYSYAPIYDAYGNYIGRQVVNIC